MSPPSRLNIVCPSKVNATRATPGVLPSSFDKRQQKQTKVIIVIMVKMYEYIIRIFLLKEIIINSKSMFSLIKISETNDVVLSNFFYHES